LSGVALDIVGARQVVFALLGSPGAMGSPGNPPACSCVDPNAIPVPPTSGATVPDDEVVPKKSAVRTTTEPQPGKIMASANTNKRLMEISVRLAAGSMMNRGDENPIFIAFRIEKNSGMNRGDLADLTAFVAVADQLSFRAAASRLGVTPSALSHSMRQPEGRLGMRLPHRTTRSVSPTDAGRRLLDQLRPAIDQIADALENLNQATRGATTGLCEPRRGGSGHCADLGALLVDVPGSPP
jgi:Bacterial regulatory helix-turn-helix protein, lysR family